MAECGIIKEALLPGADRCLMAASSQNHQAFLVRLFVADGKT